MNSKTILKHVTPILTAILLLSMGIPSQAVPYASGVIKSGNTVSFILNQNAASVEVLRDGGNAVYPGATAGTHSFDMTGFTKYQIKVTGNDAPGWTQYVPDQTSTSFEYPFGVSINKNPSSTNFGKVYVSSSRLGTTAFGRTTDDGIYMLRADGSDDGFTTGGVSWTGNSSPFKSTIGPDDHLYVSDLSNDLAYEFNDDMSVATQLIDGSNKTGSQWVGGILVEGTKAGGDRKLYLIDSNGADAARKGLIRYDLGANDTVTANDTGTQIIGPTYYGASYYPSDVARDSNGDWYVDAYRAILNQMPPITKFNGAGTLPLGAANVLWEADRTIYYYAYCLDINEKAGLAAYGNNLNGFVYFFNRTNGILLESFDAGGAVRELAFDAAGNLVTVDNAAEWARFWSPGGYTVATTSFDGTKSSFQLAKPATEVSVVASQPAAAEGGASGTFTVSRAGATASALTVYYALSGTATNGVDYSTLSGAAVIPASASSVDVTLSPLEDAIAELTETVILTLSANSNYSVVLPTSATVSILDNEPTEIAFGTVVTNKLLESYAPSTATCQVVRRGLLAPAVMVNLAYSGTATRGADFNGPLTVALAANAATANITLTPINDQRYEGDELAVVGVASGTGYAIGTPDAAYVQVVDDEYPVGAVLFSDDFNTDSTSLWAVNMADPSDCFVNFAWDYSTVGIPVAPGTTDGSTKGMRLACGNTLLQIDGLSVSPLNGNFSGNYRLKFDMWINYNGPMPDGGPGSTQNFDAGVGTAGDRAVWLNNPNADGVWFSATGDGADGNTGGDYDAIIGLTIQNDDTGFYAAGTGAANGGIRNSSHSFYSLWGGQAAPAAQLALYPNQTGVAYIGNAGMAWHTVVITKAADTVKWQMDGITICTVTNDPATLSANIFVGYQDLFASGSLSDVPEMSFGLVDNLRVETYRSAPISITGTKIVGSNVEVIFTGPAESSPSAFKLQRAGEVNGTYADDNSAAVAQISPGLFKATVGGSGTKQFYRIRSSL